MSLIPVSPEPATLRLLVKGRIPSKKNSRNLFVRGGKLFNIPSKEYAAWHRGALIQLNPFKDRTIKWTSCRLSFWAPDKRAADLSNKTESIMDLLVDAKIIEDDNWWIIKKLTLEFAGVDKENPRCEITLYDI
jgi:hypothetical protein